MPRPAISAGGARSGCRRSRSKPIGICSGNGTPSGRTGSGFGIGSRACSSRTGSRCRSCGVARSRLATVRVWDGRELPRELIARLQREWIQLQTGGSAADGLAPGPDTRVQTRSDTVAHQTRQLAQLCGVATNGALTLTTELFAWRGFTNGRQIGAIVGLTPTPYRSDQTVVEQGISRSGNRRVRALSIELAWAWLRYQPTSALSRWFHQRVRPAWAGPAHRDCGAGAQAADCLLALSGPGRAAGGRPGESVTDGSIRQTDREGSWCAPLVPGPGIPRGHRCDRGSGAPLQSSCVEHARRIGCWRSSPHG